MLPLFRPTGHSPEAGSEQQRKDVGHDEGAQHASREDARVAHLGVTHAERPVGQPGRVPEPPVPEETPERQRRHHPCETEAGSSGTRITKTERMCV